MFRNALDKLINALLPALARIESRLDRVLINQKEEKRNMATQREILDRIEREGRETKDQIEQLLTTVQDAVTAIAAFPTRVREAVDEALRNNPGADLGALTSVADELDAEQARMDSAKEALQAALDAVNQVEQGPDQEPEPISEQSPEEGGPDRQI